MVQNTPLGRLGTPKDIADLVTYLWLDYRLIDLCSRRLEIVWPGAREEESDSGDMPGLFGTEQSIFRNDCHRRDILRRHDRSKTVNSTRPPPPLERSLFSYKPSAASRVTDLYSGGLRITSRTSRA